MMKCPGPVTSQLTRKPRDSRAPPPWNISRCAHRTAWEKARRTPAPCGLRGTQRVPTPPTVRGRPRTAYQKRLAGLLSAWFRGRKTSLVW